MYVFAWRTFYALTRGLFCCLSPELRRNEGNKHQNNTRMCASTFRHKSTYIILFLTRHNESINDAKTRIFTHNPRVSLARITFCWWRHKWSAMTSHWPDNRDANAWQLIFNPLDIEFIHGDIHGRSCKNLCYPIIIINLPQQPTYPWVSLGLKTHIFALVWIRRMLIRMRLIEPGVTIKPVIYKIGRVWDRKIIHSFTNKKYITKQQNRRKSCTIIWISNLYRYIHINNVLMPCLIIWLHNENRSQKAMTNLCRKLSYRHS